MKPDMPPQIIEKEKREKFNPLTEELLHIDISKINEGKLNPRFLEITEEPQVLQNEEIRAIFTHFIYQMKSKGELSRIISNNILKYLSEYYTEDPKTKERTLDRSYRIFFELAEEFPDEINSLFSGTHYMFELVKPEVFFEVYSKLKNSDKLKDFKRQILSEQFSQLEYNMTYEGTEEYIKALESKIDFKKAESCFESSQFINIAASLADYANSGSYSGSYDIGGEINKMFKEKGADTKNIYLLGAKAEFISKRIDKGYPPFIHQKGIFELAPGVLASNYKGELLITNLSNEEMQDNFETYKSVSKEIDTPPKELVKKAVRLGLKEIDREIDPDLLQIQKFYAQKIIKNMHNINENNLTLSKNTDVSKKRLMEYKNLIGTDFRDFLEEEFNIKFNNLKIPEQFFFLEYIQTQTTENVTRLKKFIINSNNKEEKINKFRTFLSVEQGGRKMGDKILELAEKLPEESAKILFAKYGEIIDEVDNIGGYIEKSIKGEPSPLIIESAKENLLIKGKDLLSSYASKASTCIGVDCINIGKDLEEKLSNIKASLILFASVCKALSENHQLFIEDLANTELDIIHGDMELETSEEMKRIFKENRPNYPKKLLDDVSIDFEENLNNKKDNQTFYILRNNKDITSFMRLDEQEDGSIYGASFNVRTELRGSSIGSELLKKIIEQESMKRPFKIICYSKNPMFDKYKNEFGFEVTKEIENYHNTGEKFYEMVRKPKISQ